MRKFILELAGPKVKEDNKEIRPQDRRGQHRDKGGGHHAGLLLQRYLCENATGEDGNPEEKRAILQAAINVALKEEVQALYRIAFDRWQKALPELTASNELKTQGQGRLIVGLGSENVLETGIRLHHTYGMPILPGSALKGLAAHYCHEIWGETGRGGDASIQSKRFRRGWKEAKYEYHSAFFGTTDEGGCITFHDAWLTPDSLEPLKLDVMTPHHPKWNDLNNPAAPTDFDSPIPVPFLSVAGKFQVAVSWCGPEDYEKSVAWTEMTFELLLAALADWGIGGKTTSGYGRMTEPEQGKRKKPFSVSALGLPAVGIEIEAALLDAPNKGKPWRAKVQLRGGKDLSGPIDGIAPTSPQAGTPVRVIVTEVGERIIKFKWPQPPKK